jgi:hypothetical protein
VQFQQFANAREHVQYDLRLNDRPAFCHSLNRCRTRDGMSKGTRTRTRPPQERKWRTRTASSGSMNSLTSSRMELM